MNELKVLHFASGDLWAGAEVQLFHLAKSLTLLSDVTLRVVLLNHGLLEQELRHQGVDVLVLDESALSSVAIYRQFYKIVKQFHPDVVHTHRGKENVIGGLAAWLNGKKSVRTTHGASEFTGGILNFKQFIFDALDKMAGIFLQNKIVAVSPELQEILANSYPRNKLAVIENSVDIVYIDNQSRQPCPSIGAKNSKDFHIAFVGRFVPVKRVDLFIDVASEVIRNETGGSIYFHMLGDGPLRPEIEQKINQENLTNHIHLHGFVENVAPMLRQMNLLIFTSDHEGLPMTLLEAMTLHVPVLSRQLPSIHRVLCNGKCGYFVKSDSAKEFARVIRYILSNPDEVNERASAAKAVIESRYNIDINVQMYLQLYREVCVVK